jgi:hypothetical protein
VDPTEDTQVLFLYTQPKIGTPQFSPFIQAFEDWGYNKPMTRRDYQSGGSFGNDFSVAGKAVIQVSTFRFLSLEILT